MVWPAAYRRAFRDLSEATQKDRLHSEYELSFPVEWLNQQDDGGDRSTSRWWTIGKCFVPLKAGETYDQIETLFLDSMPEAQITKIEQVENRWLWRSYCQRLGTLELKHRPVKERILFHGTGETSPHEALEHKNPRFSRNGLYGFGIYLAENACFIDSGFAHKAGSLKQMIVVRAALDKDDSVSAGPHSPPGGPEPNLNKSKIHVVYDAGQIYPAYIVTYEYKAFRGALQLKEMLRSTGASGLNKLLHSLTEAGQVSNADEIGKSIVRTQMETLQFVKPAAQHHMVGHLEDWLDQYDGVKPLAWMDPEVQIKAIDAVKRRIKRHPGELEQTYARVTALGNPVDVQFPLLVDTIRELLSMPEERFRSLLLFFVEPSVQFQLLDVMIKMFKASPRLVMDCASGLVKANLWDTATALYEKNKETYDAWEQNQWGDIFLEIRQAMQEHPSFLRTFADTPI